MAPPLAARDFYASISGAFQLPPPHTSFYAFPCLNPPRVDFEFAGSRFPFMRSARGQFGDWKGELPGGRFSLGRLKGGSGYCVGNVVATRMGLDDEGGEMVTQGRAGKAQGSWQGGLGGNGMRDVWVIGEGFFRGMGVAFDVRVSSILVEERLMKDIVEAETGWLSSLLRQMGRRDVKYCGLSTWLDILTLSHFFVAFSFSIAVLKDVIYILPISHSMPQT